MPLAGRLTDVWGARRLFLVALAIFTLGSLLAGLSQTLDQLIAARLVQAVGGGGIIPVATAAAARPFVGAALLETIHPETALNQYGIATGPLVTTVAPAWRWVFYVNVPIGLCALALAWAATSDWDTVHLRGRLDVLGAVLFTLALGGILAAVTLLGSTDRLFGLPIEIAVAGLFLFGAASGALAIWHGMRRLDPFLDPRLFADRVFSSAALVSLLTGYGLATAIVGGAVFVDRVLYGGAEEQRIVLGALAGAMALGALASGLLARLIPPWLMTLAGLGLSSAG